MRVEAVEDDAVHSLLVRVASELLVARPRIKQPEPAEGGANQ